MAVLGIPNLGWVERRIVLDKNEVPRVLLSQRQKINYVRNRLRNVLQQAKFRKRYNLWQTIDCPTIRMALSLIGVPRSIRTRKGLKLIRCYLRITLKKFFCCSCGSPSFLVDCLVNHTDKNEKSLRIPRSSLGTPSLISGRSEMEDFGSKEPQSKQLILILTVPSEL